MAAFWIQKALISVSSLLFQCTSKQQQQKWVHGFPVLYWYGFPYMDAAPVFILVCYELGPEGLRRMVFFRCRKVHAEHKPNRIVAVRCCNTQG